MNSFKTISDQLSKSLKYNIATPISLWNTKTYRQMFEAQNGKIIREEAANLFEDATLANKTPEEAERLICKHYTDYKNADGMTRLWMRCTKSVDNYRQLYTIITLRNLQTSFSSLGNDSKRVSTEPT